MAQIVLEFVGQQFDVAAVAAVTDRRRRIVAGAKQAGRIDMIGAADIRVSAVLADEKLFDSAGLTRHRIADECLADPQMHGDDYAGRRFEGRWLDPEVVGARRRYDKRQQVRGDDRRSRTAPRSHQAGASARLNLKLNLRHSHQISRQTISTRPQVRTAKTMMTGIT